jgi:SAM-dependent methyltransferase
MGEEKDIRRVVRNGYAQIARNDSSSSGCCGGTPCCEGERDVDALAQSFGYTTEDLASLPEGANLGLSCGNPTAFASLASGDLVLDLGSGAGFDALIAARRVGTEGRVIGVDMTPEMVNKARANARKVGAENVEFRLGEIENLPVEDNSVDVVVSNCVINLSPDKTRVFREIHRVLKPGGRVAISDMALLQPLPRAIREDIEAYVGCISGAVPIDEYHSQMQEAGLEAITIEPEGSIDPLLDVQDPLYKRIAEKLPADATPSEYVASVQVRAFKPG